MAASKKEATKEGKTLKKHNWYCPAVDREIDEGLCRGYCSAGQGGTEDTIRDLKKWIKLSRRYEDVEEFHRVCETCPHAYENKTGE